MLATVPPTAPDSDSRGDAIPTTYMSTFMIPQVSGIPIPSITMQQPAGIVRPEQTVAPAAPGSLHALKADMINEIINTAVIRALHWAASAQNLTTPQSDPLPRQLIAGLPPPPNPRSSSFAAITGQPGKKFAGQGTAQPGLGYGWEASGKGQFSYPGIPLPPITDPKYHLPAGTSPRGGPLFCAIKEYSLMAW